MNLEKYLYFVTHHSESIIQWLFLAVLALSALIVAGGIFRKRKAGGSSTEASAVSEEIQAALAKLLEQTSKLEKVPLEGASPDALVAMDMQLKTLKKELEMREGEIAQLKAGAGAGSGSAEAATEAANGLATRVKELEAKLAEYEILEDDIADLSLYKDENSRLKAEIETIKSSGAVAGAASVPAPAPEAVVAEPLTPPEAAPTAAQAAPESTPVPEPEIAAAATADLTPERASEPASEPAPAPAAEPPADPGASDAILAEFEQVVSQKAEAPPAPAVATPFAAPPPAALAADAGAAPAVPEAEDLFAEFAIDAPPEEGALDTNKMMAEMEALSSIEPSATNSLEAAVDTDKMAAEATSLSKV